MRIHVQLLADDQAGFTQEAWDAAAARAGAGGSGHRVSIGRDNAAFAAAIGEAEALITAREALRCHLPLTAPALELIFLLHAGVDGLTPFDWLPPGVALLNNSGTHADKAGEYAAMAVLMLANHVPFFTSRQRAGVWERRQAATAAGRRVTIVGLGALGSGSARRLRLLGLHVTGVRTRAEPHPECDRVVAVGELDWVMQDTEFLVLACPLTEDTRELLDRRRIALLPRGAGVVNMGRGGLVEQDALLDALDTGHLGGAVLDVFTPEPVPSNHRLWRTPNLVMTPHMSSDDPGTYVARSLDIFFANLAALTDGQPLPNHVDVMRGY